MVVVATVRVRIVCGERLEAGGGVHGAAVVVLLEAAVVAITMRICGGGGGGDGVAAVVVAAAEMRLHDHTLTSAICSNLGKLMMCRAG